MPSKTYIQNILSSLEEMSPGQNEFYQAAQEVLMSLVPILNADSRYEEHSGSHVAGGSPCVSNELVTYIYKPRECTNHFRLISTSTKK